MVQWLGSVAFTDMAGVRFPVGEIFWRTLFGFFYHTIRILNSSPLSLFHLFVFYPILLLHYVT
ncbi:hypothetical protein BDF20DRAFT_894653, partial [Mycotypha africana]|uniref:uncharacterized protein n=1 Tax=Mycotypha africana TaxID=64632 RepID=UPI002300726C